MNQQLDLLERPAIRRTPDHRAGRIRADVGLQRVTDATDRHSPDWLEKALERVRAFAQHQAGMFTVEQMRAVLASELPEPSDLRIWGAVCIYAQKAGYLAKTKLYAPAASSNNSPKRLYVRGPQA